MRVNKKVHIYVLLISMYMRTTTIHLGSCFARNFPFTSIKYDAFIAWGISIGWRQEVWCRCCDISFSVPPTQIRLFSWGRLGELFDTLNWLSIVLILFRISMIVFFVYRKTKRARLLFCMMKMNVLHHVLQRLWWNEAITISSCFREVSFHRSMTIDNIL